MSEENKIEHTVLVCGGRNYDNIYVLYNVLDSLREEYGDFKVVNGGAKGADHLSTLWAQSRELPCTIYYAQWKTYGKPAGAIRNTHMLKDSNPTIVVAFPGGKGTQNMIKQAVKAGKTIIKVDI